MLHSSGDHTRFGGCLMHCFRAANATLATRKNGKECHQEEPAAALILSFSLVIKRWGEKSNQISPEYTPALAKGLKTFLISPFHWKWKERRLQCKKPNTTVAELGSRSDTTTRFGDIHGDAQNEDVCFDTCENKTLRFKWVGENRWLVMI